MAYVSVSEWRPEQVTEWLKGLDVCVTPYLHWFSNNEISGQQLLNLSPDELTHLGVHKIGHQELILQAVEHLRNFHYELDRENLQLLALRVSCAAHSLYNEIKHKAETTSVPTQTMADVCNVINHVKPLVSWLDRPPFARQIEYADYKSQLLRISLEMATCAQRDTFAERPISEIRNCSSKLFKLADSIMQDIKDPMLLQPASLDLATIKKRVGEDLGFFLIPSFYGIHQISEMKLSSPAHQSGKIQTGDEVVQVNYQTVVGWSRKKVLALFDESPNDLLLTLKRRPRHVKMYGQIYMKPYRLPSRKRASPYSRWNDNVPSPRPELLPLPHFEIPRLVCNAEKLKKNEVISEPSGTSSSSDEEFGQVSDSQNSVSLRLYLPKPRAPIQRRFTLSGPPRPSAQSEQFWRELQLERSWRSNQNNSNINKSNSSQLGKDEGHVDEMFHLRDKSASLGNSIASAPAAASPCINFTKAKVGSVKFDLPRAEFSDNPESRGKIVADERDRNNCDASAKSSAPAIRRNCVSAVDVVNNNSGMKLSISELNKIKRDAFFNNMDCSTSETSKHSAEDSSEKVKRIIENFKSEVSNIKMEVPEPDLIATPGKVLQLIGSFERQEMQQKAKRRPEKVDANVSSNSLKNTANFDGRRRFHCDVPSADGGEAKGIDKFERTDGTDAMLKVGNSRSNETTGHRVTNAYGSYRYESGADTDTDRENHGQMVKTINDNLLPDTDFYGPKEHADCAGESDDGFDEDIGSGGNFAFSPRKESAEIVDTVKLALVELNEERDRVDSTGKVEDNGFPSVSHPSPVEKSFELSKNVQTGKDYMKPVPVERKTRTRPEMQAASIKNPSVGPLPPKPQPRMVEKAREPPVCVKPPAKNRSPPEPPPRPSSSFPKFVNSPNLNESPPRQRDGEDSGASHKAGTFVSNPSGAASATPLPGAEISNKTSERRHGTDGALRSAAKCAQSSRTPSTVLNVITEKPKSSGSTLESLKAMLSLGRKSSAFSSPKSSRKKNAMLARKRNVSVKDVSPCDNSGTLWYRNRKGTAIAPWSKFYFVLQGPNFYGFKSKDSHKADLFIHLPGSTCTPADEVKSKDFAFKIYHTGTAFYFAANSKEDLQQWLDGVSQATICPDEKKIPETVIFSVSDSDSSDVDYEPETCFPTSPKMKKFLGSSPVPKPARSHQNLASDSKKTYDIQKRFGSLKKLSSQKHSPSNHNPGASDSSSSSTAEIASLDRKYLRFLGQKNAPTPVPTSQFRSYRRMQPSSATTAHGKPSEKNESGGKIQSKPNRDQPGLIRKTLHLSNPSLIHPDMADYRITQERLAEFRRLRNQDNTADSGGFMTLEQFMLSRQEEEASLRSNRSRPPELRGFMTLEQFLLRQEEEHRLTNRPGRVRDAPVGSESLSEQQTIQLDDRKRQLGSARPHCRPEASSSASVDGFSGAAASKYANTADAPPILPRHRTDGKHNLTKIKAPWKCSTPCQEEDDSTRDLGAIMEDIAHRNPSEGDDRKVTDCSHVSKDPTPDYPGLEYPPAFEPETYTLQCMLKNRRKRSANKNKSGDK